MRIVIHYLENIDGVAIFPIIGIFIFFSFFLGLLYYVYRMDKGFVDDMANRPLGNDMEQNEVANKNIDIDHGRKCK
jgi:cytochrome c oxidase cbb3-type subunit 3